MIRNSSYSQNAQAFYTGSHRKSSESGQQCLSTPMGEEDYGDSNSHSGMDIDDTSNLAPESPPSTNNPISFGKLDSNSFNQEIQSHTKTVQALRKYLQRKLSTEDSSAFDTFGSFMLPAISSTDSSSERESPQERGEAIPSSAVQTVRSFDTTSVPEPGVLTAAPSTLTCSIVYPPPARSTLSLQKQRSLDDYTTAIPDSRYLRTDLCVPILLSRCTFCDRSFELEDDLRVHMRQFHWHYFVEKSNSYDDSSDEALDLSVRKLTDTATSQTGSLPNLQTLSTDLHQIGQLSSIISNANACKVNIKKPVKCMTCGKGFSTKWNWKQHQKIHLRENLQTYLQQQ